MKAGKAIPVLLLLFVAWTGYAAAQTKCIWIEQVEKGKTQQKVGISFKLAKFLADHGGDFDLNGMKMNYKALIKAFETGEAVNVKDKSGNGEAKIYGGRFDQEMNEKSKNHDSIIIESSDNGETPKVTKVRIRNAEALAILLVSLGGKDFDSELDGIDDALDQGGIFYVGDPVKNSKLWIYVN